MSCDGDVIDRDEPNERNEITTNSDQKANLRTS
jgi:hypothetical protein